jgi:hypothetical protein
MTEQVFGIGDEGLERPVSRSHAYGRWGYARGAYANRDKST